MKRKLNIGIIGAGRMAEIAHCPSLAEIQDIEIVAICDINEERLKRISDRFSIPRVYKDYKEMFKEENIDAVYVLVAPHQIFSVATDCLEAGKDIFIEKPPGLSVKEATYLASLAKKKDLRVMVGFNRRFIPLLKEAKKEMKKKGQIIQCSATFFDVIEDPFYNGKVDLMAYIGIHAIDTLRWIAGSEIKNIRANVKKIDTYFENAYNALFEFENGSIGHFTFNMMVGGGYGIQTFGMGSKGMSAFVDLSKHEVSDSAILFYKDKRLKLDTASLAASKDYHKINGFYQEDCHFIDCLRKGNTPDTNIDDAVKNMEVIAQIYSVSGKKKETFSYV